MPTLKGFAFVLIGISIGVFGVTLSMIGLALTILTSIYNGFLPLGAGVAFVGVLVSIVSAVSIRDETNKTH